MGHSKGIERVGAQRLELAPEVYAFARPWRYLLRMGVAQSNNSVMILNALGSISRIEHVC